MRLKQVSAEIALTFVDSVYTPRQYPATPRVVVVVPENMLGQRPVVSRI